MKTQKELRNLYDSTYVERFQNIQSVSRLARLLPYIVIKPNYDVIDFACGDGMLMPLITPKVCSYTGVDFSEQFIDAACRKKEELEINNAVFACSSIRDFCASHKNRFDVAFAMDFAEHVYDEEWLGILSDARSALKNNGRLYIHTPNKNFFVEIMKDHNFILKQFPDHVAVRTPEENIGLIKKAGFKISKALLLPHYNVLRYIHPLSFIPAIGKYLKARILIEAYPNPDSNEFLYTA